MSKSSWSSVVSNKASDQARSSKNVFNHSGMGDGSFENPRFQAACKEMQEKIKKHLDSPTMQVLESSESEEELDESSIIDKTLEKYSSGELKQNLLKTRELLQDALTSGAVVCLICIESIKRNDSIWSCNGCFCMLHVSCIQKWAKDSMFSSETREIKDNFWCCPKCRQEYKPSEVPSKYLCFCGKTENPPADPWTIPHACGSTCEKELKPFCGHFCLLLCHPGPCPPCPSTIQTSCYCKKSRPVSKRCCNKEWSCGKPCQKLLTCKQHYCQASCHPGDCQLCPKTSEQYCVCRNAKAQRPCNDPIWQCEKICGLFLTCQNHYCEIQCHDKTCPPCPKTGPRACPCGKSKFTLPCTEEVSTCEDSCGKLLDCGFHECTRRCHFGSCGECLQMRVMKCKCGVTSRNVRCCKEIFCDNKCKKKRDCGRHNCNKKCCIGNCPTCSAPCARTLRCGRHKCQSRCHPGPCFPCNEIAEIKCACGETKKLVPCGLRDSTAPPKCTEKCKLPADCHHSERHQHRCHFGNCPPCKKICDKELPCSHKCPVKCHSAVLTKIETKKKIEGPWDVGFRMELINKPCPPCKVPISLACLGKHAIHSFPCFEVRPWSCGRKCGRALVCTNHTCELDCHDVGLSTETTQQTENCRVCEQPCSKDRPSGCTHECHQICHPGPCKPCKEMLKMKCHCSLNKIFVVCNEWISADVDEKNNLLSCKNTCPKMMECGHRCIKDCHNDSCSDKDECKKKVILRCKCNRLKKDVPCHLTKNTFINCDEECVKQRKSEKALEEKRLQMLKEEEEKKKQAELEEFQRKMEGKKKKRKKPKEIENNNSVKFSAKTLSIILLSATILGISVWYATYGY